MGGERTIEGQPINLYFPITSIRPYHGLCVATKSKRSCEKYLTSNYKFIYFHWPKVLEYYLVMLTHNINIVIYYIMLRNILCPLLRSISFYFIL